ncbi:SigB/SigF/SigG family RNA polymerase sigma factor [Streptomyces sp. NPDC001691]|uniref:SigB/SigF/SigG family RNA polymerase sigma factor n=1 Tax=unclassified Streptomyces TaxID=2593676 RepID=UPI000DE81EB6|nr:SigB/SigF/SigG family RNA polymerase sigma factor [Streptomyces sp. SDr-06]RCH63967.1 SigB/SigF/SigG family RNA polymerase sigma factor [Streptomyces sp. SDr-06]
MTITAISRHRSHDDAPDTAAAFAHLNTLDEGPERDALRESLVAQWLPMARRLAGKYRNRGADLEDLYQVAAMGLVKAVDRYEAARGAFEAYAVPTITGEIKRHFRDSLWSVHVPRRVQELRNKVRVARSELQTRQPGEPTIAELAAHTGLQEDEVRDGLEALQTFKTLSLDAETTGAGAEDGDGTALADSLGITESGFDTVIDREAVKPALRALPERESKILYMRFFQDKTQNQIADELGISQMHVSRLIARTCARIRRQALAEHQIAA